ncbi:hypothetical protein CKM354_000517400 [Cercospora kikuchii]|uniref:Major facilitator superfamily (MFS) profile domain-containing protein n=1 Tax=Cercospora kikuchii TaxID=84275 RepID=A0A9P3CK14_9PEZI|nr:uncharacterized protein CKM354_000517400 [Cercospora kikuchii]GIZ41885.1 hypothetical protein CKM354_000517400 [Cercospora kikuchii]
MAGGSMFLSNDAKNDPREIFNGRLLYLLVAVAWAGMFYGFDQGNIGGIMELPSFERSFGLVDDTQQQRDDKKGTIAAMLAAGGSLGALMAAPSSDYLGRKWSVFTYGLVFMLGAALQMVPNFDVLLAGRFIGGLGVGSCSMLVPQFLSENAPRSVRGSMVCTYNLCIIVALMIAFWVNYGVSLWSGPNIEYNTSQWQTAMSIQLIPGGFMCLMVPFLLETPRYLIRIGKNETGLANLSKLRGLPADHPYVQLEYNETYNQIAAEQDIHAGNSYWQILKDIFTIQSNFQRFVLAIMLFLFHKLTGTDSLNYFAPRIFQIIGVSDGKSLLTTGVYGVVKFVTTIFYVGYLVEHVGRRLPLIVGATIQASCMLYLALYVRFGPDSETVTGGTPAGGIVGIIAIYLYAFGWSFGHSVACYVVAAEIFPARIRSFCMSFCFFTNWIVNYGITRATPNMITTMGWGIFLMYAVLTYLGVGFVWLCLPETKGRSIESMDDLFQHPLWMMWKFAYPKEEDKVRRDVQDTMMEKAMDIEESHTDAKGAVGTVTERVERT